jgi:hypothetical protein
MATIFHQNQHQRHSVAAELIGYSVAIALDNGCYDRNLRKAWMLACIWGESNWIVLSIEKQIIVWRWLVVTVFLSEEQEERHR